MKSVNYILGLALLAFIACTPKATEVVEEAPPPPQVATVETNTPCKTFASVTTNRDEIETAYVLYRDAYKAGKYEEAFPIWEKAFNAAPAANGKVKYQFEDGIYMYRVKYDLAPEGEKEMIVNKIMELYDKKSECFGQDGYNAGRKAFDYYYYFRQFADNGKIFDLFKQTLASEGMNTQAFVLNPLTALLVERYFKDEAVSLDEAKGMVTQINSILKKGLASGKNAESWDVVKDYVPAQLEIFEGEKGFYDCEYFKAKYLAEFDANPTDCDVINVALGTLRYGGCGDADEAVTKIKAAKAQHCKKATVVAAPTATTSSCARQGYDAYQSSDYDAAIEKYACAIDEVDDSNKKAQYALLICKMYFSFKKNFPKARQWAEKAASYRSGWGEPYIIIGKLYASSGPKCGTGRGFESQTVTWPAIDMFAKAKQVDPSVAAEANRLIGQYSKYMPSYEDIFARQLELGGSFRVGCWINRNTTIRKAP